MSNGWDGKERRVQGNGFLLARLDEKVDGLTEKVEALHKKIDQINGRVTKVEFWKERWTGAILVLSGIAALSGIASVVSRLIGG